MNEYKVIGMQRFVYTSKRTGKTMDACKLYCTFDDSRVVGVACLSLFCPSDCVPGDIVIGDKVAVYYNRFGGVAQVSRV